jgi:transcription elongation factor GreA
MSSDQQTYITKKGLEKLKAELNDLIHDKRTEIAERISQAKELGDLSENAEYAAARNDQAFNEGRIIELESILKNAIIIEEQKGKNDVVNVGSTIKIKEHHPESDGPKIKEYFIVGSHEADPFSGKISNESPIGKALLGAKKGETVEITLPKGVIKCEIVEIK